MVLDHEAGCSSRWATLPRSPPRSVARRQRSIGRPSASTHSKVSVFGQAGFGAVSLLSDEGVCENDGFSHDDRDGEFGWFSVSSLYLALRSGLKRLQEGRHAERLAHDGPAAGDDGASAPSPGLAAHRCQPALRRGCREWTLRPLGCDSRLDGLNRSKPLNWRANLRRIRPYKSALVSDHGGSLVEKAIIA